MLKIHVQSDPSPPREWQVRGMDLTKLREAMQAQLALAQVTLHGIEVVSYHALRSQWFRRDPTKSLPSCLNLKARPKAAPLILF